ncbi:AraC family transcriptional regulator [Ochrobactrum sp. MYb68]|nr:AraC family transcriptional regulator [Ochrobactrum sp. MYb68]
MSRHTSASNQYMEYIRPKEDTTVYSSVLNQGMVTATRITRSAPNFGFVDQHVTEDAFMLSVQLKDYHGDLWVDGKKVDFPASHKGNFTLYDYNRIWQADLKSAFDCVNFYLPRSALVTLEEDFGSRKVENFNVLPGADIADNTIRGLTEALLPALENPAQASRLFVDHVGLALAMHMAATYGTAELRAPAPTGGLAPWQLKRAMAIMDSKLDGDIPIAVIAQFCGLSPSYFTRAFKISTGMPPHKWLLKRKVEKATNLLRTTRMSLSEIAVDCGFVDQSHFTRVFSRAIGAAPGQWRKSITS